MENKKSKWDCICEEYINDETATYSSLAKKYNTTPGEIYKRSKQQRWYIARAEVQKQKEKAGNKQTDTLSLLADRIRELTENIKRK